MPPKQRITKQMILEAAFKLTRDQGFDSLNARSIAKKIGCSTQPVYSCYAVMDDLKRELFIYLENYYNEYVKSRIDGKNFFLSIGLAYIEFARNESNLFRLLFMSDSWGVTNLSEMLAGEDNAEIIQVVARSAGISIEVAKELFLKIWIFTHGIASIVATNSIILSQEESQHLLKETYIAYITREKEKNGGKENE